MNVKAYIINCSLFTAELIYCLTDYIYNSPLQWLFCLVIQGLGKRHAGRDRKLWKARKSLHRPLGDLVSEWVIKPCSQYALPANVHPLHRQKFNQFNQCKLFWTVLQQALTTVCSGLAGPSAVSHCAIWFNVLPDGDQLIAPLLSLSINNLRCSGTPVTCSLMFEPWCLLWTGGLRRSPDSNPSTRIRPALSLNRPTPGWGRFFSSSSQSQEDYIVSFPPTLSNNCSWRHTIEHNSQLSLFVFPMLGQGSWATWPPVTMTNPPPPPQA